MEKCLRGATFAMILMACVPMRALAANVPNVLDAMNAVFDGKLGVPHPWSIGQRVMGVLTADKEMLVEGMVCREVKSVSSHGVVYIARCINPNPPATWGWRGWMQMGISRTETKDFSEYSETFHNWIHNNTACNDLETWHMALASKP